MATTFKGFGAAPATTTGFGAAPATATGFGAAPATATGFGAAARSQATGFGAAPATATGFGAAPATATGFGAAARSQATGFGIGFGGVGLGVSSLSSSVNSGLAPVAAVNQVAYPGIKGPGNCTTWMRAVDFTQVTDSTPYESLPAPLQQHLVELRTFMHAERQASEAVRSFLEETGSVVPATSSYRTLQHRITQLLGGPQAVGSVMVSCIQQEREAQQFVHVLDQFERDIALYEQRVWNPLAESRASQGDKIRSVVLNSSVTPASAALLRCYDGEALGPDSSSSSSSIHAMNIIEDNEESQLFVKLMEHLQQRMTTAMQQIYELERALAPASTAALTHAPIAQVGSTSSGNNISNKYMSNYRTLPCAVAPSVACSEENALLLLSSAPTSSSALSCTAMAHAGTDGMRARAKQITGLQTIAQITASLQNAAQALVKLSGWTAGLHARSNVARELFARQYGRAEADALFAPPTSSHLLQLQMLINRPVDHVTRTALCSSQFTSQNLGSMNDISSPAITTAAAAPSGTFASPPPATSMLAGATAAVAPAVSATGLTATAAAPFSSAGGSLSTSTAPVTAAAPAMVSFGSAATRETTADDRPTRRAR